MDLLERRRILDLNDQKMSQISVGELERRWRLVREYMAERGIDALVAQNAKDFTGGYVKWFTDIPAAYPRTVIFHAADWMTIVEHGPAGKRRMLSGAEADNPGVGEIITTAAFPSVSYTQQYDAAVVSSVLKKRGCRRIGLVAPSATPNGFITHIEQTLSANATISDETDFIDRVKAVKSQEEISLIRKTAEMQDAVFDRVTSEIRPGMRNSDVTALAQYHAQLLGSEQGIFLGMSARMGEPVSLAQRHFQGRTLQAGDYLPLLIENSGVGGFYTELARTIVLGKASSELFEGLEIVREAQQFTVSKLRAGASCREIFLAHNDFMKRKGVPPETRLYAHSQGYDLVERPIVRDDETLPLEENMNMAIHPAYATASAYTIICDNYLIGPDGAGECLHKTPKKVFEVC
jgi:Xaa-Pro aminopeptidase